MASTFNLVRNSRVFFTTNVDASTGVIPNEGGANSSASNTFELQVLDGFSFSQGTQQSVIQISEAGSTPVRGQRAFNTQLDPVDFSFSTYVRPAIVSAALSAEESVLWNALFSAQPISAGTAVTGITSFARGTSLTPTVTVSNTAVNLSSATINVGDYIAFGSFTPTTVTNVTSWEGPVKLLSFGGTTSAATSLVVEYQTAPPTAAGTTLVTATAMALFKCAWVPVATTASSPAHAYVHTGVSNLNQLQKFGMIFSVDNIIYAVDNCALDQASIDFGLDGIATIAWTGKGTALRAIPTATVADTTNIPTFGGTGLATGPAKPKNTTANYITNKLSTMSLKSGIQGSGATTYNLALTGGNLTVANNINYVVPANLGVVNQAIGYFTGTRSITGNVTAYLRTGTNNSAQVLQDILDANDAETKFKIQIEIGGLANAIRVETLMDGVVLQVPTVETGDVMSTTINFTAQGYDPTAATNTFDLERTNDLHVTYYSS
jgi:hypothetical protein